MSRPPTPPHGLPPLEVAADAFLLRAVHPILGAPLTMAANSLVLRGPEPVVIDTGGRRDRDRWLADLTALLDPLTVRWIVLSHDAEHHRGNLAELLARCPDATVVAPWSASRRLLDDVDLPVARLRWLDDAARLDVGDRMLHVLRPPVYDSPATRAVFDTATGLLWTSDLFAAPMPLRAVDAVDELSPRWWAEGLAMVHHHALAPWLSIVDRDAYAAQVRRLRDLHPSVVVGAHSPVIAGGSIEVAFEHLAALPDVVPPPHPAPPAPAPPAAGDPMSGTVRSPAVDAAGPRTEETHHEDP